MVRMERSFVDATREVIGSKPTKLEQTCLAGGLVRRGFTTTDAENSVHKPAG